MGIIRWYDKSLLLFKVQKEFYKLKNYKTIKLILKCYIWEFGLL